MQKYTKNTQNIIYATIFRNILKIHKNIQNMQQLY